MNYFQRYLAEEFTEDYSEGRISRRKALKLIAEVTGSMAVASSLLAACAPPAEQTPQGQATSPNLAAGSPTAPIPVSGTEAAASLPAASLPAASLPAASLPAASLPATPLPAAGTPTEAGPGTPGGPETAYPAATSAASGGAQAAPQSTAYPAASTPGAKATQAGGVVNATVSPDDPAVTAGDAQFPGQGGATLLGYLARPASGGSAPVVLVCHENRGLTDHIRDVTRRLAKAGYVALAVDLLSRQGGTAKLSADAVPGALGSIDPNQFVADFRSGWEYLKGQSFAQAERVGMVGFCFGGGVTWSAATKMPELRAAVPYYGPPPPVEQLATVQAAVLAIYGGNDTRITSTEPAVEAAMKKYNKVFDKVIYPGADHAFNNDTGPRYNAQAANDAWGKTLAWFGKYLKG
jgi:carboxymethylenebutenolidase